MKRQIRNTIMLAALCVISATAALPLIARAAEELPPCGDPNAPGTGSISTTGTTGSDQRIPGAEWLIEAQTSMVPDQFEHKCFNLRDIVKTRVRFGRNLDPNSSAVGYEQMWFHDGRALGMERHNELSITPKSNVGIRISHSTCPSTAEAKAAANAILRLVLDVKLHGSNVPVVRVPSSTFTAVSQALQNRGGKVLDGGQEAPPGAKVVFKLESEPAGSRQVIYFI